MPEQGGLRKPSEVDSPLLALGDQFNSLLAELTAVRDASDASTSNSFQRDLQMEASAGTNLDNRTREAEAILARLYPIELTILSTPARTLADLGIKARHAAYVMSEYWETPINQLDWDARTARLLIEAICNLAGMPLPFDEPLASPDFC
jgi:hypothetical protein